MIDKITEYSKSSSTDIFQRCRDILADEWSSFERWMDDVLERQQKWLSDHEMLFYRGGKRIRPMLLLLFHRICSQVTGKEEVDRAVAAAASLEIAHVGSLIHDDIVDKAPLRRGMPTFHSSRGYEFALLLGDLQIIESMRVFASFVNLQSDAELMRRYIDSGYEVCRGQIEELLSEETTQTTEALVRRYFHIIDRKTGRLFSFACEAGARLGGARPSEVKASHKFGVYLGRAFQIMDDVFDVVRPAKDSGKQEFIDLALGRLSLPVIYALDQAPPDHFIHDFIRREEHTEDELEQAKTFLRKCNGHLYAYNQARIMIEEAKTQLKRLGDGDNPYRSLVWELANHVVDQGYHG